MKYDRSDAALRLSAFGQRVQSPARPSQSRDPVPVPGGRYPQGRIASARLLARNPFGQIPVLELDDGTCLRESGAILVYLAEGTALLPDDKLLRARVLEWMGFEQTHVDGVISRARFRRMFPEAIPTRDLEFVAWHAEGREALAVLDAHLADRTFLVDERFTIADIALFAYTHCADQGGFDLSPYEAIHAWFGRVRQQRGYLPIEQVPPR